jgi:hypothetical protein
LYSYNICYRIRRIEKSKEEGLMETWKNRDMIYDVVIGAVEEGNANPEVKTVFGEDSLCEKLYEEIYQTKERLSQRLGKEGEEDADIEKIINNMFDICRIVGNKMYEYGMSSQK